MANNINDHPFTEETELKLEIISDYFKEWLPVFLFSSMKNIYIFDLFAGSGDDIEGSFGSPLRLLEIAKNIDKNRCAKIREKNIVFIFNEKNKDKSNQLLSKINVYLKKCAVDNLCGDSCYMIKQIEVFSEKFKDVFNHPVVKEFMEDQYIPKFILLDQYGFKEIDEDVFGSIVSYPMTDSIFFISSSQIRRFRNQPAVTKYFDTNKINFDETKPKECHREIANYYRNLIPKDKEYYLHHFTIKKNSNYYGLIFASSHTLGMEKILKVCWEKDLMAGESNCNINNDFTPSENLLYSEEHSSKINTTMINLKNKILKKEIIDNISGMKYVMINGCRPNVFHKAIGELLDEKKVEIDGKKNKQSTNIHKCAMFNIRVI